MSNSALNNLALIEKLFNKMKGERLHKLPRFNCLL